MKTNKIIGLLALTISATFSQAETWDNTARLIEQLKEGGLVVYIRHAQTEKDYADQITADPNNCSTQRVLSEAGWNDAIRIGKAFEFYGIPANNVKTSEYCRAWKTASLAFGEYDKKPRLNFLPFEDYTQDQVNVMKRRVTPMLSKYVKKGKNRVIVAHDDPFEAATGIYPEPQGSAYIVKPKGKGKFEVLGCISPEGWSKTPTGPSQPCSFPAK